MKVFCSIFLIFSLVLVVLCSDVRRYENTKAQGCVGEVCGDVCSFDGKFVLPGTKYEFKGGFFECHKDFSLDA